MKTKLTVSGFSFESAHNLYNYDGKCANVHGHSYKLSITVEGEVDKHGFVVDFHEIKQLVQDEVINRYDHKYLNDIEDFNPTAENLVNAIARYLKPQFSLLNVKLVSVRLWETENCMAEVEL